ncbi:hypothetical protein BC940DRAFT_30697 [Gongronella butleri]|nr:hypothetical protein BC940DRAFT_30697 [Gongronella butleri]
MVLHSTGCGFMVWLQLKMRDLFGASGALNMQARQTPLLNPWRIIFSNRSTVHSILAPADLYRLNYARLAAWIAFLGIPIQVHSIWSVEAHAVIEWVQDEANWWPLVAQYHVNVLQRIIPGSLEMPLPNWSAVAQYLLCTRCATPLTRTSVSRHSCSVNWNGCSGQKKKKN